MEYRHMVRTVEDVAAYRFLYEDAVYAPRYGHTERRHAAMGEARIYSIFGPPIPLLDLIMFQIRLPSIYFLLEDHPAEMAELLTVMHARNCEYYEAGGRGARRGGALLRGHFDDADLARAVSPLVPAATPGLPRRSATRAGSSSCRICADF